MTVLIFPGAAYFLIKAYRPVKDPSTGRVTYQRVGVEWAYYNLYDPVQREHAHNFYLSRCPQISQADRDKVASDWADIRHAREAEEKKREELRQAAEEMMEAEEEKGKDAEERKRRIEAMVEESEGVATNIAKAEKAVKAAGERASRDWMDVVMG